MDVTPDAACSAEVGQPASSGAAVLPAPMAAARGEARAQLTLQVLLQMAARHFYDSKDWGNSCRDRSGAALPQQACRRCW